MLEPPVTPVTPGTTAGPPAPAADLGPILYQWRRSGPWWVGWTLLFLAPSALLGAIAVLAGKYPFAVAGLVSVAAGWLFLGWWTATTVIKFHEAGLLRQNLFGRSALLYRAVERYDHRIEMDPETGDATFRVRFVPRANAAGAVEIEIAIPKSDLEHVKAVNKKIYRAVYDTDAET